MHESEITPEQSEARVPPVPSSRSAAKQPSQASLCPTWTGVPGLSVGVARRSLLVTAERRYIVVVWMVPSLRGFDVLRGVQFTWRISTHF